MFGWTLARAKATLVCNGSRGILKRFSNRVMECKVSVCIGLRNKPHNLQTPFLSVNPPHVACLNPVCVLMNHMMPSLHHQLTHQVHPIACLTPAFSLLLPLVLLILIIPVLMMPPSKSPLASPQDPCWHCLPSLDCATSAHPLISVKLLHFAWQALYLTHRPSLRTVIIERKITRYGFIWPLSYIFHMFPLFYFCLRLLLITFSHSLLPLPSDSIHCCPFQLYACCCTLTGHSLALFIWSLDPFVYNITWCCQQDTQLGSFFVHLLPTSHPFPYVAYIITPLDSNHINIPCRALSKGRQLWPFSLYLSTSDSKCLITCPDPLPLIQSWFGLTCA